MQIRTVRDFVVLRKYKLLTTALTHRQFRTQTLCTRVQLAILHIQL